MSNKPIDEKVQDVVYNLDVGVGYRVIQAALAVAGLMFVVFLFQISQFKGFKDAESMEYAQLGRNLLQQKAFVTQVVRPASMEYLRLNGPAKNAQVDRHPDLFHAPLYPLALSAGFALFPGALSSSQRGVFPPEIWVAMPINHVFGMLTVLLVWLIGRRLFNNRIGLLGALCYALSRLVWEDSVAGIGLTMVYAFSAAAFYLTIVAADEIRAQAPARRWGAAVLGAAVLCGLAALTRYAALMIVPGLLLYLGFHLGRRSAVWIPIFCAVILMMMAPWMLRNIKVSGAPFGLTPYLALNDTSLSDGDAWQRALQPPPENLKRTLSALRGKVVGKASEYIRTGVPGLGDGPILWPMFVATFFFHFVRREVRLFRWALLVSMLFMFAAACFFGAPVFRLMHIFWPFIVLYGFAFFFILLDRLQFELRLYNIAVTAGVVALTAAPYVFALLPPRAGVPYPPYFPPFVQHVSGMLQPGEVMCSDMPWATAWYGRRTSIYLPRTVDEFYQINDYQRVIKGVYFTTLTRDLPYARQLLTGPYKTWFPVLQGRIPQDFPLTQALPMNNLDQLFLTDQLRSPGNTP